MQFVESIEVKTTIMNKNKRDKQQPDKGQGSKGNFGSDADVGKKEKKSKEPSSPVPPRKDDDQ